jgi:ABC-type multidrug transport system fused ATPase/permease subunit
MRDIRVFGARDVYRERMHELSRRGEALERRQMFLSGLGAPAYQYLGLLLVIGALAAASRQSVEDVAALAATALLLLRSLSYGQLVQNSYQSIIESAPYFEQVQATRSNLLHAVDGDGDRTLSGIEVIEFRNVSFSYDGRTQAVRNLGFELHRGETVGIVGPSGSGKSTIAQLLLRLRQPSSGQILSDGVPAEEFTLESWYEKVSYVPQQPTLLHESLAENVRFFDDEISDESVRRVADRVRLGEFIDSLDDGVAAVVGSSVRDLSGGQLQRIGIARALVRRRDIVVLDEPTSALDVDAELAVSDALDAIRGTTMLVIIAHRVSTLATCDRIIVLEAGRVVADGSAAEVAESNPFFARALRTGVFEDGPVDPTERVSRAGRSSAHRSA